MGTHDFIDPVWFPAWVVLGAIYLVTKSRNRFTVYIVQW